MDSIIRSTISRYTLLTNDLGFWKTIGIPSSVASIISREIGIVPSSGTPSRWLSFAPPPVLNKSSKRLNCPFSFKAFDSSPEI